MKIIPSFLVLFLVILILPGLLSLGIIAVPINSQPGLAGTIKIYGSNQILEQLTCPKGLITQVGISFKNPSLNNKKDLQLIIEDEKKNILSEAFVNGKFIPDGGFVKFKLNKPLDCHNITVFLRLLSPDSVFEDALEVLLSNKATGDFDSFIVTQSQSSEKQSINLVLFVSSDDKFKLINTIYRQWWDKFTADKTFAIFYTSLILGLFILGTYSYTKTR